jgi:hypothetical protein
MYQIPDLIHEPVAVAAATAEVHLNTAVNTASSGQTLGADINIATSSLYEQSTLLYRPIQISCSATSSLYGQPNAKETNTNEQYEDGYAVISDTSVSVYNEIQYESSNSRPTLQHAATDYYLHPYTEVESGQSLR